jgi:ABC-2 type transport system permease protein
MSGSSSAGLEVTQREFATSRDLSLHSPGTIPDHELHSMSNLRRKLWLGTLRNKLSQARLRLSLIVILSICFWFGLYSLFYGLFQYFEEIVQLKEPIFNTYFMALMLMLLLSSGLITYSGLYRSEETRYLLTLPISGKSIVHHKLFEAVWFGGWGFLLTSTPMLVASGVQAGAPWYYYALMLPFLITYMYIPATLGALCCVLIINLMPRKRMHFLIIGIVLLLILMGWIGMSVLNSNLNTYFTPTWFKKLSEQLHYFQQRVFPSWWLSSGLLLAERSHANIEAGYQSWSQALMFLAVLGSNAMLCYIITTGIAGRLFRTSFQRLQAEHTQQQSQATTIRHSSWNRWLGWPLPFTMRILIQKELRIFLRDPVQWLQFAVFIGLLALYVVNIKHFPYEHIKTTMIGFLNLAVVGLILSTFTTRFIYPMVSLEGRRFWILNLLPIQLADVLIAKFLFAALGSWLPCAMLIFISDYMLSLPAWITLIHQLTVLELCVGLAAMAVGLGAIMRDMREESPSKIAAGFGGTLNLVLSALFILQIIAVSAVPCQLNILYENKTWSNSQYPIVDYLATNEVLWISQGINFLVTLMLSWGLMARGVAEFRDRV